MRRFRFHSVVVLEHGVQISVWAHFGDALTCLIVALGCVNKERYAKKSAEKRHFECTAPHSRPHPLDVLLHTRRAIPFDPLANRNVVEWRVGISLNDVAHGVAQNFALLLNGKTNSMKETGPVVGDICRESSPGRYFFILEIFVRCFSTSPSFTGEKMCFRRPNPMAAMLVTLSQKMDALAKDVAGLKADLATAEENAHLRAVGLSEAVRDVSYTLADAKNEANARESVVRIDAEYSQRILENVEKMVGAQAELRRMTSVD